MSVGDSTGLSSIKNIHITPPKRYVVAGICALVFFILLSIPIIGTSISKSFIALPIVGGAAIPSLCFKKAYNLDKDAKEKGIQVEKNRKINARRKMDDYVYLGE